jgi:hypothetical protein
MILVRRDFGRGAGVEPTLIAPLPRTAVGRSVAAGTRRVTLTRLVVYVFTAERGRGSERTDRGLVVTGGVLRRGAGGAAVRLGVVTAVG